MFRLKSVALKTRLLSSSAKSSSSSIFKTIGLTSFSLLAIASITFYSTKIEAIKEVWVSSEQGRVMLEWIQEKEKEAYETANGLDASAKEFRKDAQDLSVTIADQVAQVTTRSKEVLEAATKAVIDIKEKTVNIADSIAKNAVVVKEKFEYLGEGLKKNFKEGKEVVEMGYLDVKDGIKQGGEKVQVFLGQKEARPPVEKKTDPKDLKKVIPPILPPTTLESSKSSVNGKVIAKSGDIVPVLLTDADVKELKTKPLLLPVVVNSTEKTEPDVIDVVTGSDNTALELKTKPIEKKNVVMDEVIPVIQELLLECPLLVAQLNPTFIEASLTQPLITTLLDCMTDLAEQLNIMGHQMEPVQKKSLTDAAERLIGLSCFLAELEAEEVNTLMHTVSEQADSFYAEIEKIKREGEENLKIIVEDLTMNAVVEQHELEMTLQGQLNERILEQTSAFKAILENALTDQAEQIDAFWSEHVKQKVDDERDGRLARLDHLALKLRLLEDLSLDSAFHASRSHHIGIGQAVVRILNNKLVGKVATDLKREWRVLQKLGHDDEFITTLTKSIPRSDLEKYQTPSQLLEEFEKIRLNVFRAQFVPEQAGLISVLFGVGLTYLLLPKHGLIPGKSADAVLSRAAHYLELKDVDSAAREMNQLKGWSRLLADDWMVQSRRYLHVKQAVDLIETKLKFQSIGVLE